MGCTGIMISFYHGGPYGYPPWLLGLRWLKWFFSKMHQGFFSFTDGMGALVKGWGFLHT
jgi:hypothetical protein